MEEILYPCETVPSSGKLLNDDPYILHGAKFRGPYKVRPRRLKTVSALDLYTSGGAENRCMHRMACIVDPYPVYYPKKEDPVKILTLIKFWICPLLEQTPPAVLMPHKVLPRVSLESSSPVDTGPCIPLLYYSPQVLQSVPESVLVLVPKWTHFLDRRNLTIPPSSCPIALMPLTVRLSTANRQPPVKS